MRSGMIALLALVSGISGAFALAAVDPSTPVRVRFQSDPTTLDWNLQLDTQSERVSYQLMEGLVSLNDRNEVQPALAESWKFSPDKRQVTFKIRKSVLWSDGKPLTAQHFVDSWERLLNPKTGAEGSHLLFELEGAEEYGRGKTTELPKGFVARDEHTLVVRLTLPSENVLGVFDHPVTFPIRKDVIEKWGKKWTEPGNIVTLGSYLLKEWKLNSKVTLVRNAGYWGKKSPYEELQVLIIADDTTALNLFGTGGIDLVFGLPIPDLERLSRGKGFKIFPQVNNTAIGMNVEKPPFDNVKVRKAFAHATDNAELCRVLPGGKTASARWIPEGIPGPQPGSALKYDVAKARAYLKEAGFEGGKGLPKITLYVDSREESRLLAERLQGMWATNLGVQVEILAETWKTFLSQLRADPPQLFRFGWAMTYRDPHLYSSIFTGASPMNRLHWKNGKYDSFVKEAATLPEWPKRLKLYEKAEKVLLEEEAALIPLYKSGMPVLLSPRMSELRMNGRSKFLVKDLN